MKNKLRLLALLAVGALLVPAAVAAQPPALPYTVEGDITINGVPSPAGTEVTAEIDDTLVGTPFTTTAGDPDHYVYSIPHDASYAGKTVVFYVNGVEGGQILYGGSGGYDILDLAITSEPDITVDKAALNFGTVAVGGTSAAQTVTVGNDGAAGLNIGTITIAITGVDPGDFALQNDNCSGQTIEPDDSATFQVVFSPSSASDKSATVEIPSNDPDEDPVTVDLSGNGESLVDVQMAVLMDTSGSVGSVNWGIMTEGLASAVEDPSCVPHDGSIELTMVRFGSSAQTVVGPVVITSANADTIAADIRGVAYAGGGTCMSCAFDEAATALSESPNFDPDVKQVINLVTDGYPNSPSATIDARDDAIDTLEMTEAQDEIDCEAIGAGADVEWLKDNIAYPQPGYEAPPFDQGGGWVRQIDTFEEFADSICEKLQALTCVAPAADFSASPRRGNAPLTVKFTDRSRGTEIDTWAWVFGDGGTSTAQNPSHTYSDAGRYRVTLTVTGLCGTDSESLLIVASEAAAAAPPEPPDMSISNLFISATQVAPRQTVEVSVNVNNNGGQKGARVVTLFINGHAEQSQSIAVSPGGSQLAVFRVAKTVPGTYQVAVDGQKGQFSVLAPEMSEAKVVTVPGTGGGLGTAGIIVIVVVAVAVIVAIVILFRRTT
jgi:hypothetical protein